MERLTEKTVGCFEYALKNHTPIPGEFGTYEAFFDYSMAVKKLGKYEDAEEAKAQQPMTNGDRIRAMTDEELAEFLGWHGLCEHIQNNYYEICETRGVCGGCVLNWLKQTVRVEE